jgi:hypothetical protein
MDVLSPASAAVLCTLENATSNKFTAFNMSSMHMKTMMAFLRVKTPTMPILNKARQR